MSVREVKNYDDPEWLRDQYIIQRKNVPQIAEEQECSVKPIRTRLKEFNIVRPEHDPYWLKHHYIELNESIYDIAELIGCNYVTVYNNLIKHGIYDKDRVVEKRKQTMLERYGAENPTQVPEIRDKAHASLINKTDEEWKIIVEKRQQTSLDKYGTSNPSQNIDIIQKRKESNKRKFGGVSPAHSPAIRDKIRKTTMERFGVDNVSKSPEVKRRKIATSRKNYGVDNPFQSDEIKKKSIATLTEKYGADHYLRSEKGKAHVRTQRIAAGTIRLVGDITLKEFAELNDVPYTTLDQWYRKSDPSNDELQTFVDNHKSNITSIEHKFQEKLGYTKYDRKFHPDLNYRPDFKLTETIALNVDGLYWHSEAVKDDKHYHFNMRKEYEDLGLRIFQFRGDEIRDKFEIVQSMVSNAIGKSERIYARKCEIRKVLQPYANKFLAENHIMGTLNAKHVGLYLESELVMLFSYKMKKDKTLKIERLCGKLNTVVLGGFSKLLKYLEAELKPKKVESWVDLRYGTGYSLEKLGFTKERDTLGWKWTDGVSTFNRLACRANMDERKLSEREYAEELGWIRVYDAGQRLYCKVYK